MDSYFLIAPGGSVYDLGSFLDVSEPLDFGFDALDRPVYAESPLVDGAAFGFESSGVRTWQLPLILPSGADAKSLDAFQAALRLGARPGGGKLVAHPFGVASAEAVHFDVLSGRWRPAYHARERGVGRTRGTLELDTQPFGYWPTMILLASAASVGGPGVLAVPGASVIGDVPGLAELFIAPTTATSYGDTQKTDAIFWSLSARPSFQAFWRAASAIASGPAADVVPTLLGDQYAPASQTIRFFVPSIVANSDITAWRNLVKWIVPPALEPAYRGIHRAFCWARVGPSQANPWLLSLDTQSGTSVSHALASAAPVASLPIAAAATTNFLGASPAYSLLDLGEISLPPVASTQTEIVLRLWAKSGMSSGPNATTLLDFAGLYLLPVGQAGVLPRGLLQPSWITPSVSGRLHISAPEGNAIIAGPTSTAVLPVPIRDALGFYRGSFPLVGGTVVELNLMLAGKQAKVGAPSSHPPLRTEEHYAHVSLRYRPRFTFSKTI